MRQTRRRGRERRLRRSGSYEDGRSTRSLACSRQPRTFQTWTVGLRPCGPAYRFATAPPGAYEARLVDSAARKSSICALGGRLTAGTTLLRLAASAVFAIAGVFFGPSV